MMPDFSQCLLKDEFALNQAWKRLSAIDDSQSKAAAQKVFDEKLKLAQEAYQVRMSKDVTIEYPRLPISEAKDLILETIRTNQVTIIAGETGSGKSTQLAKMCLSLGRGARGWIGHTQPRRLAARAIGDRVSSELQETLGETVGYKVRFHDNVQPTTRIKLMTDGILLNEVQFDKHLLQYDTIIIDEAHERTLNIDILLGLLKKILAKRSDLKVIVTSATIELEAFSKFFNDAPIIQVPGQLFPVETFFMERESGEDFFSHLTRAIDRAFHETTRDILVFLSGEGEIFSAQKILKRIYLDTVELCPLFAKLNLNDQRKIFTPGKRRRIILATNVAETSLTVPNISAVIDSGVARISRYNYKTKIQRLPIEAISKASITQRTGRAGRLSSGSCYRLFSLEDFESRSAYSDPEIQRTNLAQVVLQMSQLGIHDLSHFEWLDPPERRHITDAIKQLERLEALEKGALTKLGAKMARMPLEPKLSKILISASKQHCLEEILIIVSGLCIQDPREYPKDALERAQELHRVYKDLSSDFLSWVNLWQHLHHLKSDLSSSAFRKHCQKNMIHFVRFLEWRDVYHQLKKVCLKMKFQINTTEATYEQIHKALLTGLFETVGLLDHEKGHYDGARAVKFLIPKQSLKKKPKWIMAFHFIETKRVFASTCAKIEPVWIEQTVRHLCKYESGELFWEPSSGYVKIYEKVSFFGLVIASRRQGKITQAQYLEASQIFIEQALVDVILPQYAFVRHNADKVNYLIQLEERRRKLGSLFDKHALIAHYQHVLPESVNSLIALDAWIKEHGDEALRVAQTAISFETDLVSIERDYPDQLALSGFALNLSYKFDLSDEDDGVTLDIPVNLLAMIRHHDFSWGIPGFVQDKITWYLEKLDKTLRRRLPTLKQCVSQLMLDLDRSLPFVEALKKGLLDLYDLQVPILMLEGISEPNDLTFLFRVLDEGKVLDQDRDFLQLVDRMASWIPDEDSVFVAQKNCIAWSFGDLPKQMNKKVDNHVVTMFPALVDKSTFVNVELFSDPTLAKVSHGLGCTRLAMLLDQKRASSLKKNMNHRDWFKKNISQFLDYDQFFDDIMFVSYRDTYFGSDREIRLQKDFDDTLIASRLKVPVVLEQLVQILYNVFRQLQQVKLQFIKIKRTKQKEFPKNVKDIERQIDALIYVGFVSSVPMEWLLRYPHYLKALSVRMEKFLDNPGQDTARFKTVLPLVEQYEALSVGRQDEACLEYRWLIEEYRITVFAQPMKSKRPISSQKMKQWLRALH